MSLIRPLLVRTRLSLLCSLPAIATPSGIPTPTILSLTQVRTYAAKAKGAKSTATLIPGSQQKLTDDASIEEYEKAEKKMQLAVDWYKKEVAGLETRASGRVTPALLDSVRVEVNGELLKLEEVATVGVREGSTLLITMFEDQNLKFVEKGLYDAKIPNIVPHRQDSCTLKIPIPKPTIEARNALATTAQRLAEDSRVQIRKIQGASTKKGKYAKHSVELEEFQKLTDKNVADIDKILARMKKVVGSK